MALEFGEPRWKKVKEDSKLWWAGKLKRPLIHVVVRDAPSDRPEPAIPSLAKDRTAYDLSITPEMMIDRLDYDLSRCRWLGDAFPSMWVDFGPGVMAAFMGAAAKPDNGTVWFHPDEPQTITELQFNYDAKNTWLNRIKEICRVGMDRWGSSVLMGMTDLGGNLDVLSTFLPSEALLLDLYDHPADVKRLTWREHELWWKYFDEINSVLRPANPGYSCWTLMFSEDPYYMLQCDFAYMLGPEMFQEFVLPELAASCRRLSNAFYHLDGVGQLKHLDALLSIPELKGIQWIPGAGKPGAHEWPEVLRKVREAGKLLQLGGTPDTIDCVARELGSLEGTVFLCTAKMNDVDQYEQCLRKYGAV